MSASSQTPSITLTGFTPTSSTMAVTSLSGKPTDSNETGNVGLVQPQQTSGPSGGSTFSFLFPANSFTILRLQ